MSDLVSERSCNPRREAGLWVCDQWRSDRGEWFCGVCGKPTPPVEVLLSPGAGRSGPAGQARKIVLNCERTAATRDGDLADYALHVGISDPHEAADAFSPPLEPAAHHGQVELGLEQPAGS